ncbi:MAG: conjugal transfer protein TraX [Lachnospiraceae bacterium]|nr:conjugal transfer protein TraX [Lachnospiraceae bacterium]
MTEENYTVFWDKRFGRNFLKIVALITMLCDHLAVVLVSAKNDPQLYNILRMIGRISFPVICFMITEGFRYTSNRKKYLQRMFIFAVISEIPFDLVISNSFIDINNQNVIWTLLIGLLVLMGIEKYSGRIDEQMICIFAGSAVAFIMKVDYSFYGILIIAVFYMCRENHYKMFIIIMILLVLQGRKEAFGILSIPFIMAYDSDKEEKKLPKYFFYIFYPLHLTVLYMVKIFI